MKESCIGNPEVDSLKAQAATQRHAHVLTSQIQASTMEGSHSRQTGTVDYDMDIASRTTSNSSDIAMQLEEQEPVKQFWEDVFSRVSDAQLKGPIDGEDHCLDKKRVAIFDAASSGNLSELKSLLASGADVDCRGNDQGDR